MKRAAKPLRTVLDEMHWMRELPASAREQVYADSYDTWYRERRAGAFLDRRRRGIAEKVSAVHRSGKVVMLSGISEGSWMGEGRGKSKISILQAPN